MRLETVVVCGACALALAGLLGCADDGAGEDGAAAGVGGSSVGGVGGQAGNGSNAGNGGSAGDGASAGNGDSAGDSGSDSEPVLDVGTAPSGDDPLDCDPKLLRCRIAELPCPEGQVHQMIDDCYGPCVPVDRCACDAPDDCPHEEQYTCHMFRQRCGPYL